MLHPARLWIYRLATCWMPETRLFGLKAALLRWCGAQVGTNVRINSSARISGNGQLIIGDNVWIGPGAYVSSEHPEVTITLEDSVGFGPRSMLITGYHHITPDEEQICGPGAFANISIGAGSCVYAGVIILPGVTLAPKTIVTAGAVVTKSNLQPKAMIGGLPAKTLKTF